MTSRSVTVANRLGLHARAAARFVHLASRFQAQVRVTRGAQTMDGKSIMGILLLAAVDALCRFIESGFGEDTCNA